MSYAAPRTSTTCPRYMRRISRASSVPSCSRSAKTPSGRVWCGRRCGSPRRWTSSPTATRRRSMRWSTTPSSSRGRIGDGAGQGHRVLLDVRAPHAAVLRAGRPWPISRRARSSGSRKIARIVDVFARRLQVQERLTDQVAEALEGVLGAARRGCGRRGPAPVHDDARRPEAEQRHDHQRDARHVQERRPHPRGVPRPGSRLSRRSQVSIPEHGAEFPQLRPGRPKAQSPKPRAEFPQPGQQPARDLEAHLTGGGNSNGPICGGAALYGDTRLPTARSPRSLSAEPLPLRERWLGDGGAETERVAAAAGRQPPTPSLLRRLAVPSPRKGGTSLSAEPLPLRERWLGDGGAETERVAVAAGRQPPYPQPPPSAGGTFPLKGGLLFLRRRSRDGEGCCNGGSEPPYP